MTKYYLAAWEHPGKCRASPPGYIDSWMACTDQEALTRAQGLHPNGHLTGCRRADHRNPDSWMACTDQEALIADVGRRVRTQMGTRQDTIGPTSASQVLPAEIYIPCGWHTTYSLMAKPKALPTNKKRKTASKATKTPMKTARKKLNNGTSKCHRSDASDDNTSSSDAEPPPQKRSRHVEVQEISDDQPESNVEVVDEAQVRSLQSLEWMVTYI